ncbi:MAG: hypothetical protein E5Y73_27680 [Mesorhizobium sp.]|nr:MAG: hypothetical protein E5Y73_27680 [Mesorhizobium sp.]TIR29087.1 MAG: hypothetical protein E5X35_28135 [Mesorhizobium sp.]
MRVAVVWNNDYTGVINRFGQPRPRVDDRETVEMVMAALQESGHETLLCEGDKGLLARAAAGNDRALVLYKPETYFGSADWSKAWSGPHPTD